MVPDQLATEVEQLRAEGCQIDLIEADGWANVVIHGYGLPAGYSSTTTELLLKFPLSYPNGRPDMFWTDAELTLKDGSTPRSADQIEPALGRSWRRFSWHPQGWNPATNNLRTYLAFVETRLAKAV